jgi:hypothetical protein
MTKAGLLLDNTLIGGTGVGGYHRLLVLSPDAAEPYNYLTARLIRWPVRLSTLQMVFRCQWRAIPYMGAADTMNDVVLFNATTT